MVRTSRRVAGESSDSSSIGTQRPKSCETQRRRIGLDIHEELAQPRSLVGVRLFEEALNMGDPVSIALDKNLLFISEIVIERRLGDLKLGGQQCSSTTFDIHAQETGAPPSAAPLPA